MSGVELYLLGSVIAVILGALEAYEEHKEGRDISHLGAGFCAIFLLSWIFVIIWTSRNRPSGFA